MESKNLNPQELRHTLWTIAHILLLLLSVWKTFNLFEALIAR